MAESRGDWKRQGYIPVTRRAPDDPDPEPLYAAVLASWRRTGRTLPGRPDPEWNAIVNRDIWPR
ncbi:hypothetical protein [Streptomyces sp. NPDC058045]|uniref:hypothetical protein n=1 Tax=Streptomyces sp. NPDC058045 TaxID=3346311 RepID=UPI0036EF2256